MMDEADYRRIERLILMYPYYLDDGRFDDMGKLFADADVYIGSELAASKDPAAVAALWRRYVRIHSNGTPRTHHIATNIIVDEEGPERARAHSYILVVQHAAGFPLQPITAGDYLDRFAKSDGTWRFIERRVGNDLFGNLSHHLIEPMAAGTDIAPQRWERL
ncbi:nuclear transport factor 2 family protein [Nocardia sp. CA2R105]|uniref:nuclear transport factor 2 family protein n=1 Tax=Nocardia coffeae TaxID=2873381 RepID=UPI001CA76826|nr:nuclear transport factor 2 family protein [Nocardia coffeae]MBY8856834.1 nuclear transport factor 2 family protein [Nocardia coffeae]